MINEIKLLTKVQMCNFFGINEARYSKDSKKRNKIYTAAICLLIFGVFICAQVGGTTYLLVSFGLSEVVPSMVGTIITSLTFTLNLFRAGPTLFNIKSFEKTVCLPIRVESMVISRFLNLYLYNMLFTLAITASAVTVYGVCAKPGIVFYPTMIIGMLLLPLLPLTLAVILGTVGYYFASRVQRKNLMSILWQLGVLAVVFGISFSNTAIPDAETVNKTAEQITNIENYYFILKWFSNGVNGNIAEYILFAVVSVAVSTLFLAVIAKFYKKICIGLSSTTAKRNFKMTQQGSRTVFKTLYIREIKRYFSSATYVMNTILGFVFAVAFGILIIFLGIESLCEEIGIPYWMMTRVLPIVIGLICNMMPTTAASISMEGKNFWLLQSLPIRMKNIANAKILLNLTFAIPACLISSTCLMIALEAEIIDAVFIYIIPIVLAVLGSVTGLYMNILYPMMEWESDTVPVKQSKSGLMTMFALFLGEIAAMIVFFMTPNDIVTVMNIAITAIFALITAFIYNKIVKTDIKTIK